MTLGLKAWTLLDLKDREDKMNRKKYFIGILSALVLIPLTYALATYSFQRYVVNDSQIYDLRSDGTLTLAGPIKSGNNDTGASVTLPTTTTGAQFSRWVPVYNVGAAVTQGDLLISSNTGTAYVRVAPATLDLTNVVGVAAEAIASGANGWMIPRGGGYAIVHASGTISIGDVLVSSGATSGYAWSDTTPTSGAGVAIAMSANTSGSGNGILAIME